MNNLQIISDKNKKSQTIKKILLKKINQNNFIKRRLVVVIASLPKTKYPNSDL